MVGSSTFSALLTAVVPRWSFSGAYSVYAKSVILNALECGIRKGTLRIEEPNGTVHVFGEATAKHPAVIVIRDDNFWVRVYKRYDVGFSEAYMEQEMDTPDMKAVLNLYVDNLAHLNSGLSTVAYKIWHAFEVFCFRFVFHGLEDSRENVAIYNVSNDMYRKFLSTEMMYSCPIWDDAEGGVRGDLEGQRAPGDLEAAQERKIKHILDKAQLRPGDRLLEIGSGWGSMAIGAALRGCTVDTLTLNEAQQSLAVQRIAEAGLSDKINVHLMDYREMPRHWENQFDACISIEMLEAVGVANMNQYVGRINWALKKDRAAVVMTSTTYPDPTYTPYQGNDFVRMYHWRHTVPPSPFSLLQDFQRYSGRQFTTESLSDFGPHYPRCLREWGRRLETHWYPKSDMITSLIAQYPEFRDPQKLESFHRRWKYMFVYMEVAYARQWLSLHTWCLTRPGQVAENCA